MCNKSFQIVLVANVFFCILFYKGFSQNSNSNLSDTSKAIVLFEKAKLAKSKGEYYKALEFYQEALEIKNKYSGNYEPDIIRIYNNIGNIYLSLLQIDKSWEFFDKAEKCLKERFGEKHSWLGSIYMNKGVVCGLNGDNGKELFLYNQSLAIYKNDKNVIPHKIILIYHNIGSVFYEIKNYEKALEYFDEIINLSRINEVSFLDKVYNFLGMTYFKLDNFKEADRYFMKSVSLREKKYGYSNYETAKGYYFYGSFCADRGNLEKGLKLHRKAYDILINTVGYNNLYTSKTLLEVGNYYLQTNNLDSTLNYYQQALLSISPGFSNKSYDTNPQPEQSISKADLAQILKKKAIALQQYAKKNPVKQEYYLKLGLNAYVRAIETIEQLRSGYLFEESKLFLTENEKETYSELIAAALDLYRLTGKREYAEKAYVYAEKNKATVLLASIREGKAKQGNIPDSLQEKEMNINREIAVYEKFVHDEKESGDYDTTKVEQWESTIFNLYLEKEKLLALFESEYPAYHKLKYDHSVKDLKTLQEDLDENQVLLEYTIADTLLITQVITPEDYYVYTFHADSNFYNQLEVYTNCLRNYDPDKNYLDQYYEYISSANYLYEKLVVPLNIPEGGSLVIVPDEMLSYIPFEALLCSKQEQENEQYHKLDYLLYHQTISYAYTADLFFEPFKGSPTKTLGAFAPGYQNREEFMPLDNTKEVQKIQNILGGQVYCGNMASKQTFLEEAENYEILVLHMHGLLDMENEMNSCLAFCDEDLSVRDLYGMRLNAKLLVSNACNTGNGRLRKGEGIMSVSRAFTYAGCFSTLTSLWVYKNHMGNMVTQFFRYYKKGNSTDRALQQAKIKHLKNKFDAHPHYWAGLVLNGKSFSIKKSNNKYYFLLAIPLLFAIFFYIRKRKYPVQTLHRNVSLPK